ncbi:hypothetical protein ACVW1C_001052 [Bradyrhizobium sp. USDA 4011]
MSNSMYKGAELDVLRGFGDFICDIEAAVIELPIVKYNRGAPSIDQILSELRQMDLVLYDIVDEHRFQGNVFFRSTGCLSVLIPHSGPSRRSTGDTPRAALVVGRPLPCSLQGARIWRRAKSPGAV